MVLQTAGKTFIIIGLILVVIGVLMVVGPRIPFLEKIPGNFRWQKGPVTIYFPLGLCILASIVLTLIFHLFGRK